MAARPVVTVYSLSGEKKGQVQTPGVFSAPIRGDIVSIVHRNMAKNRRQPYAVKHMAGMGHSAESWGTGRAVARIPRVSGGGTSRAGQAAFGNMCRKGRMFAPTKIWRKWHIKTPLNQKRYATVSAVAATASTALVMARGHAIGSLKEVPIVVDNAIESITKTKQAIAALQAVGAGADVLRCKNSRALRTGVSRMRNRVHSVARGPLVVYNEDNGICKAFRNIPGVQTIQVKLLNVLALAPGGHMGRFTVWTQGAFEALQGLYGSTDKVATEKVNYMIPQNVMTNSDVDRIVNSTEIQSILNAKKKVTKAAVKLNPLTNFRAKVKLNPYAAVVRQSELLAQARAKALRKANAEAKAAGKPELRSAAQAKKAAGKKIAAKAKAAHYAKLVNGVSAAPVKFDVAAFKKAIKAAGVKKAVPASKPKAINAKVAAKTAATATIVANQKKNAAATAIYIAKKNGKK